MGAPTLTHYTEGGTPRGMEFVGYDLDDDGIATLTYEHRDGIALHVHTTTRYEGPPANRDARKAWGKRVLSKRPRMEMQIDAMFTQLGPSKDGKPLLRDPRDMRADWS